MLKGHVAWLLDSEIKTISPKKRARQSYRIVQGKDKKLFNKWMLSMYSVSMHLNPLRAVCSERNQHFSIEACKKGKNLRR